MELEGATKQQGAWGEARVEPQGHGHQDEGQEWKRRPQQAHPIIELNVNNVGG